MQQKTVFGKPADCNSVLLHACCAPCSSAIVEWLLNNDVHPTIFYFNPNIWPREEYEIRKTESKRHAESLGIAWLDGDYDHENWRCGVSGLEGEPERGLRCEQCFTLRLTATARKARELGIEWFATTLASSRWKSLDQITRAGLQAEALVPGTRFWAQNWRKGGLQERRNQLLREYGFYNQQYCGCEFSAHGAALTKPVLRQQMRQAKQQHQQQLPALSENVTSKLLQRLVSVQSESPENPDCPTSPKTLLAYWPLPDEVDIRPLVGHLIHQGWSVVLPKVLDDDKMELHRYTSCADLSEGAFHIMEPAGLPFTDYQQISVALIPGMAFDAAGHRLGRGRGYYDRFLSAHPQLYKIGVCFPFQRVAEVPSEEHDVAMDEVIA